MIVDMFNVGKVCVGALLLMAMVSPGQAKAYVTTSQAAARVSDTMIMYLVTYTFGHDNFSYRLPINALRGKESVDAVSYDIVTTGKLRTNIGETTAIVLSRAVREDGAYVVEKGEAQEFTLVAFLELPAETSATSTYALKVSALPFELETTDGSSLRKLNDSELVPYQTPALSTDKKIAVVTK